MILYQEPSHTIYCGHAIDVLQGMPAECVDMAMTSPPYWGLRTYKTQPIIWGDNHCEHEWTIQTVKQFSPQQDNSGGLTTTRPGRGEQRFPKGTSGKASQGQFCLKCNAWRGELGLEPTVELYIQHLILIFSQVKRVLKKTGTCWVNLDDSYASGKGTCLNPGGGGKGSFSTHGDRKDAGVYPLDRGNVSMLKAEGLTPKTLCLIPQRFAIAMLQAGWILRNDIAWNKPNPMPESVKDRFTGAWEHLMFFVKNNEPAYWTNSRTLSIVDKAPPGTVGIEGQDWEWVEHSRCHGQGCNNGRCVSGKVKHSLWDGHDYWFDQQFEPYTQPLNRWGGDTLKRDTSKTAEYKDFMNIGNSSAFRVGMPMRPNSLGRNQRDVWDIPTTPYPEAHFATFPEKLCEIPILAGCPSEVCTKCGKARVKIYNRGFTEHNGATTTPYPEGTTGNRLAHLRQAARDQGQEYQNGAEFKGYSDCGCDAGFAPGVVLDPFAGSGTSQAVAKRLGLKSIGIELNPSYCKLAAKRLQATTLPMALVHS